MNRHQRRKVAAQQRVLPPLPPARQDGRPLFYDIEMGQEVQCYHCEKAGLIMRYGHTKGFLCDPANTPDGSQDLIAICHAHLPENAVIYNQHREYCRNKDDTESWQEG